MPVAGHQGTCCLDRTSLQPTGISQFIDGQQVYQLNAGGMFIGPADQAAAFASILELDAQRQSLLECTVMLHPKTAL